MNKALPLIVLVILLLSGCSRVTKREIGEKHKSEIDIMLHNLKTLALEIPSSEFDPDSKELVVEPYFHVADLMSNTVMGSQDNFLGLDKQTDDPTYFDMYLYTFRYLLRDRYLAEPAEEDFESNVKSFTGLRYAIVYHPVDYRDATINNKEFSIDPLTMIVAMYDIEAKRWIFAKRFVLNPPEKIEFSYRPGQEKSTAEFEVKEHFINTVKPQIAKYLEDHLDGTFEFDDRAYRRDGTRSEF